VEVLLLGPQGSGKGTQAVKIAAGQGIPHIATGDMFRAAVAAGSELGRRVQPLLEAGRLVPDEITVALIRDRLAQPDADAGFVLDGFPRTLAQAEALDGMLAEIGRPLSIVLLLEVDDDVSRERLAARAELEGRADDARPEVIERRLEIYHRDTEPVVEHYLATGKLVKVHAERSIPEVFAEIQQALDAVAAREVRT
jgi:adenylate kinase